MGSRSNRAGQETAIPGTAPDLSYKLYDDAAITLIKGLDLLMLYARAAGLLTAANMLDISKEDISCWAAEQNFHEYKQIHSAIIAANSGMLVLFEALIDYLSQLPK